MGKPQIELEHLVAYFFENLENHIWKFQKTRTKNLDVDNYDIY
jgi:hypothetical protein